MFGPHLVLEGYECANRDRLASPEDISYLLDNMPSELDMNVIMPTRTMRYDGGDVPEDWGVSGFVIIAESHLSIHTFPDKGFFAFDAFSCKPFDLRSAIVRVVDFFGCSRYEHKVFDRGREFPRCPDRSQQIVHGERQQAMQCR